MFNKRFKFLPTHANNIQAPISRAANWGFGTYFGMSIVSWEGCNYRKQLETNNFNIKITEAAEKTPKHRSSRSAQEIDEGFNE